MNDEQTKENKITVGLVLGWIFGVLFGIAGVATVFTDPVSGILLILMAAIVLPPATKLMKDKFNFSLSGGVKAILIIALLGLAASTMDVSDSATSAVSDSTTVASENATTSEASQQQEKVAPIEIVSIDTRVTESNQVWWKYAWKLVLKNNTDRDRTVTATIKWVDADGFVVDNATEYGLKVPAQSEATFNEFTLIDADVAANVEGVEAEID